MVRSTFIICGITLAIIFWPVTLALIGVMLFTTLVGLGHLWGFHQERTRANRLTEATENYYSSSQSS